VALAEHPPGCLPDHGEGLRQEVVEVLAVVEAGAEFHRLGGQLLVGQLLDLGLERTDLRDDAFQRFQLPAFAQVEKLVEDSHRGRSLPTASRCAARAPEGMPN
jgi:hypothetical protein